MTQEEFSEALTPWLKNEIWSSSVDHNRLSKVAPLVQERTRVLSEGPPQLDFFFLETPEIDQSAWEKVMTTDEAPLILESAKTAFQAPIRLAVTGRLVGPPLFESMHALGREMVLERLEAAHTKLGAA